MLNATFKIADKSVGPGAAPYVVAEAGSNFNQSLDTARKLIDVAVEAGADCVKFQLFRADVLQPKGTELYEIFKSVELNADWVPSLNDHARQQGIHFSASAFDPYSLAVLVALGVPLHKVASSETTNLQFVHSVAAAGKPVLLSTGMCDMVDVEEAVTVCEAAGNWNVALLQCGAMYPLPPELANLKVIQAYAARFGCPVGFSDHTLGFAAAAAAAGLGATTYEKHFTLDKTAKGPDHSYALEPAELKTYVATIREAHAALGTAVKDMLPDERKFGRREGLYAARAMAKGETITVADVLKRRPALGLRDRHAGAVVGATLTSAVDKDQPLTWDVLTFVKAP